MLSLPVPDVSQRFTLVSSAHIANNPRLVKEADALVAAGHRVRVVTPRYYAYGSARDDALMAGRVWTLHRVPLGRDVSGGRLRWAIGAAAERLARLLFALGVRAPGIVDRAVTRGLRGMVRATAQEPADVVIAHTLQALPVAGRAAGILGARLGFDIEDLHVGELADLPANALRRAIIGDVERRWLPRCHFLTASSDGIADEIVRLYGVSRPCVILNVFPRAELARQVALGGERPPGARVSLYWYSQVIGRGRGIEDSIRALAALPDDVHLSLRGAPDPAFLLELREQSRQLGLDARLHLLPPAAPEELVALAGQHDVGLALEQPHTRNRELCVTNKLFTYLLAGLAVVATDTEGQRAVMTEASEAGVLCPTGDADALTHALRGLATDTARLARAKRAAAAAAASRFNWERERISLVEYLTGANESVSHFATCARS